KRSDFGSCCDLPTSSELRPPLNHIEARFSLAIFRDQRSFWRHIPAYSGCKLAYSALICGQDE
ncbi:MAG: hypothetical protein KKF24_00665, partial [Gammaproteobacteria bacterium]|nr:hypothetical protein [Gammaproteobacteria bacterium]